MRRSAGSIIAARFAPFRSAAGPWAGQASVRRWIGKHDLERIYREAPTIPVRDIMSSPVYTVEEEGTLADVLDTMHARRVEQVPVVREGRPLGIVVDAIC